MKPSLSRHELREVFTRFLYALRDGEPIRRFTASGMVEAFTVHDPEWRFVLDGRATVPPAQALGLHIDDPGAPPAIVEVFVGGETLDKAFSGELHVRSAMRAGLIRFEGDLRWAIRLIPAMMDVVPLYRAMRIQYAREKYGPAFLSS